MKKEKKRLIRNIIIAAVALAIVFTLAFTLKPVSSTCLDCSGTGKVNDAVCETCNGTGMVEGSFLALVPPIIAIILALVTKEVYSSLFIGVVAGALFYTKFHPVAALNTMLKDGFIAKLSDSWNVGILIFLVLLGILVALITKAGGSAAFGRWAQKHIKTRTGAQLATFVLGVLIFVDDYFNCLTVGSVMRPVTDSHNISRAKLAYIIDATAAPICIIAPISSWAAAVSGVVEGQNGLSLFCRSIPYNFYSLVTIFMIVVISIMNFDYGPMRHHEFNAMNGDLFSEGERNTSDENEVVGTKGKVIDLVLPVILLVLCCVAGMIYTGGFFGGKVGFIDAFANSDASVGLSWGAFIAIIVTTAYLCLRRVISFKDAMACIPKGFISMIAPILILTLAWTLSGMTQLMNGKYYVAGLMHSAAGGLSNFLPAIIFLVALALAFATGTSWGTFGILIPIVVAVFGSGEILTIGISACLAGAVCGDHCSPISDTTIMASAGAQCNHVNHVTTQLPYAMTAAAVSFVGYIIAGFIQHWYIALPITLALMFGTLLVIKKITSKNAEAVMAE